MFRFLEGVLLYSFLLKKSVEFQGKFTEPSNGFLPLIQRANNAFNVVSHLDVIEDKHNSRQKTFEYAEMQTFEITSRKLCYFGTSNFCACESNGNKSNVR